MTYYLEALMFTMFVFASLVWFIQISKQTTAFTLTEKIRAITFMIAFYIGMSLNLISKHILIGLICMIGVVISQLLIATIYYENYKDKEIVNE